MEDSRKLMEEIHRLAKAKARLTDILDAYRPNVLDEDDIDVASANIDIDETELDITNVPDNLKALMQEEN